MKDEGGEDWRIDVEVVEGNEGNEGNEGWNGDDGSME